MPATTHAPSVALLVPPAAGGRLVAPPPCFFWKSCRRHAQLEKQGKSVCRVCAERLKGVPYPLRAPTREPLYRNAQAAAEAMEMLEADHKKRNDNRHAVRRRTFR